MSIFLALRAPEALQAALRAWVPPEGLGLRPIDPAQLHLTLAFLGELPADRLGAVASAAAPAAAGAAPFHLRPEGLGAFPSWAQARVLWWGLAASAPLQALADALRARLREAGLPVDPKPFRAHLTLGRFRSPRRLPELVPPAPAPWPVTALALLESRPGPAGVQHHLRGEWPLAGGEARP